LWCESSTAANGHVGVEVVDSSRDSIVHSGGSVSSLLVCGEGCSRICSATFGGQLVDLFLVVFGIATTAASCRESFLSARVGSGHGFRFPDCAICLLYLVLGSQRLLVWFFELGETCVPLS